MAPNKKTTIERSKGIESALPISSTLALQSALAALTPSTHQPPLFSSLELLHLEQLLQARATMRAQQEMQQQQIYLNPMEWMLRRQQQQQQQLLLQAMQLQSSLPLVPTFATTYPLAPSFQPAAMPLSMLYQQQQQAYTTAQYTNHALQLQQLLLQQQAMQQSQPLTAHASIHASPSPANHAVMLARRQDQLNDTCLPSKSGFVKKSFVGSGATPSIERLLTSASARIRQAKATKRSTSSSLSASKPQPTIPSNRSSVTKSAITNSKPSAALTSNFRNRRTRKRRMIQTFPIKLHKMICAAAQDDRLQHLLAYTNDGTAFSMTHDTYEMEEQLFHKFFRHKNFASFRRQLCIYGFIKVSKIKNKVAYAHPLFLRDQPELAKQMVREPIVEQQQQVPIANGENSSATSLASSETS
ncbi:hypothetical protein MPSEU_000120100 [Mayamaea pseudoterrestris]|nr:hypothetical protein MPSEU_000120100 [Mayamaea pseudoterrestris]